VYEENGESPLLIGRQYISPDEIFTRKVAHIRDDSVC
jgi:hypothetical protein